MASLHRQVEREKRGDEDGGDYDWSEPADRQQQQPDWDGQQQQPAPVEEGQQPQAQQNWEQPSPNAGQGQQDWNQNQPSPNAQPQWAQPVQEGPADMRDPYPPYEEGRIMSTEEEQRRREDWVRRCLQKKNQERQEFRQEPEEVRPAAPPRRNCRPSGRFEPPPRPTPPPCCPEPPPQPQQKQPCMQPVQQPCGQQQPVQQPQQQQPCCFEQPQRPQPPPQETRRSNCRDRQRRPQDQQQLPGPCLPAPADWPQYPRYPAGEEPSNPRGGDAQPQDNYAYSRREPQQQQPQAQQQYHDPYAQQRQQQQQYGQQPQYPQGQINAQAYIRQEDRQGYQADRPQQGGQTRKIEHFGSAPFETITAIRKIRHANVSVESRVHGDYNVYKTTPDNGEILGEH